MNILDGFCYRSAGRFSGLFGGVDGVGRETVIFECSIQMVPLRCFQDGVGGERNQSSLDEEEESDDG